MLKIDNLVKYYGSNLAIDNLNLEIPDKTIFGFIGPNGAGKTTTIKLIATLIEPTQGEITIKGTNVTNKPQEVKKLIGYIPDTPFLYEKLTGREFIQFAGDIFKIERKIINNQINELNKFLGFGNWLDNLIESYSHGMKQRIVIASALIHNPYLLLVDEPMVGLDPLSAKKVKDLFKKQSQSGNIVFISTHTLSLAEEICDMVGVIHHGKLIYLGSPRQIIQEKDKSLEEVFLQITAEEVDLYQSPAQSTPTTKHQV
jgi:ABC-2 type transport system ATP-binding protein